MKLTLPWCDTWRFRPRSGRKFFNLPLFWAKSPCSDWLRKTFLDVRIKNWDKIFQFTFFSDFQNFNLPLSEFQFTLSQNFNLPIFRISIYPFQNFNLPIFRISIYLFPEFQFTFRISIYLQNFNLPFSRIFRGKVNWNSGKK